MMTQEIIIEMYDISIHAPREGSDELHRARAAGRAYISIHAPREGSDPRATSFAGARSHFYPRSPRGERPGYGYSIP